MHWLDDEWEGIPDPPAPHDPERAIRRIAAAILLRACMDAQANNRYVRDDARRFLQGDTLKVMVQISGINRAWFRRRLVEFLNR